MLGVVAATVDPQTKEYVMSVFYQCRFGLNGDGKGKTRKGKGKARGGKGKGKAKGEEGIVGVGIGVDGAPGEMMVYVCDEEKEERQMVPYQSMMYSDFNVVPTLYTGLGMTSTPGPVSASQPSWNEQKQREYDFIRQQIERQQQQQYIQQYQQQYQQEQDQLKQQEQKTNPRPHKRSKHQ